MEITNAQLEQWAAGDFAEFNYRTSEVMALIQTLAGRVLEGTRHGSLAGLDVDDCPQYEWRDLEVDLTLGRRVYETFVQGTFPNPEDEYGIPEIVKALPVMTSQAILKKFNLAQDGVRAWVRPPDRQVRVVDLEKRVIEGYAIIWGETVGEWVIEEGAISREAAELYFKNPVVFYNCNHGDTLGRTLAAESDDVGLRCRVQFTSDYHWRIIEQPIKQGLSVNLGVSGIIEVSHSTDPRHITKLDLQWLSVDF